MLVAHPHTRMGQRPPKKTSSLYKGPMRITNIRGSEYTVQDLISSKESKVHISLIKPFEYDPTHTDPKEVAMTDDREFLIDHIIKHEGNPRYKKSLRFLVRWANYPKEPDTWEPWKNLRDTEQLHMYLRSANLTSLLPKAGKTS